MYFIMVHNFKNTGLGVLVCFNHGLTFLVITFHYMTLHNTRFYDMTILLHDCTMHDAA